MIEEHSFKLDQAVKGHNSKIYTKRNTHRTSNPIKPQFNGLV